MAEPSPPDSRSPEWETLDLVRLPQPTECFSARIRDRRFAPHSHETFSIGVVESGAICTRYRGTMLVARVGDVLRIIDPRESVR